MATAKLKLHILDLNLKWTWTNLVSVQFQGYVIFLAQLPVSID